MERSIRFHPTRTAVWIAAILGISTIVSLVTSTLIAGRAYESRMKQQVKEGRVIAAKGSARLSVRSDLAVWRVSVAGDGATLREAYDVLERSVERVQKFLTAAGFASTAVALGPIDTQTRHVRDKEGRETTEIAGYDLDRLFTITTAEVEKTLKASGEVTQLLQDDVRVTSRAPEFLYTKMADVKIAILGEASKDARARADEIASKGGCRVTDVREVRMGVIQITRPHSTEVSDYGVYDTETIEKDVSVVVTAQFGLEGA